MVNFNLQVVVIRYGFPVPLPVSPLVAGLDEGIEAMPESERGPLLGRQIAQLRPELDLFLVTDINVEEITARLGETFKRVFFGEEDHAELYRSIMRDVAERHRTPFFNALRDYAKHRDLKRERLPRCPGAYT